MSQEEFASQWAILPARVRYDAELPPNAKFWQPTVPNWPRWPSAPI